MYIIYICIKGFVIFGLLSLFFQLTVFQIFSYYSKKTALLVIDVVILTATIEICTSPSYMKDL